MALPTARPGSTERPLNPDLPEIRKLFRLFQHQPRTLRIYHAAGKQLERLANDPNITPRGGWRKRVAEAVAVSESTLNKCLQFRKLYEESELVELEGQDVGWSRLTIALGVQGKRKRHQLLQKAAKERWDDQSLQRVIQQLKGTRRGGGRPPKKATGLGCQPDLTRLIGLTVPWSDFYGTVWVPGRKGYFAELKSLTAVARTTLEGLLEDAATKLEAMRRQCGDALAQVKDLRRRL